MSCSWVKNFCGRMCGQGTTKITHDPDLNFAFFTPFLIDSKIEKGVQSQVIVNSAGGSPGFQSQSLIQPGPISLSHTSQGQDLVHWTRQSLGEWVQWKFQRQVTWWTVEWGNLVYLERSTNTDWTMAYSLQYGAATQFAWLSSTSTTNCYDRAHITTICHTNLSGNTIILYDKN